MKRAKNSHAQSGSYSSIHGGIVVLLESARRAAARSVNALMTATYWEIGRRIVEFEQGGKERAAYGESLIRRLAADLSRQFGRGFGRRNLWQMRAFHLTWPVDQIAQTASAESDVPRIGLPTLAQAFPLPWSAYLSLLSVENLQARSFYETEALRNGWSVRQLGRQIGSQFYERSALSPNKVLAAEYRTVLPDEKLLIEELNKTRREYETRRVARAPGKKSVSARPGAGSRVSPGPPPRW